MHWVGRAMGGLVLGCAAMCSGLAQTTAGGPVHRGQGRPGGADDFVYIGTYTGPAPNGHPDGGTPSKGIYVARFDAEDGKLGTPQLAAQVSNPAFLALAPNHRFLYAGSEDDPESFVSAYAINPQTGALRLLNRLPSGGAGTAYISVDKTGRYVLVANYGSGSVSVLRIRPDGSLGELTCFMQHAPLQGSGSAAGGEPVIPHPHSIVPSPDDRYAIVPDLGLNKLFIYRFNSADGTLSRFPPTTVDLPPDSGPRHFVFSPDGMFGYLIAQTTGDVIAFRWDAARGMLTQLQIAPSLPKGLDATNMSAEIEMSPKGRFLYESNRRFHGPDQMPGPDSIGVFRVNPQTGSLKEVQESDQDASIPRCFSIDPTGAYLLVSGQQTNKVEVFRIHPGDGTLSPADHSISLHTPACMQFVPARQ